MFYTTAACATRPAVRIPHAGCEATQRAKGSGGMSSSGSTLPVTGPGKKMSYTAAAVGAGGGSDGGRAGIRGPQRSPNSAPRLLLAGHGRKLRRLGLPTHSTDKSRRGTTHRQQDQEVRKKRQRRHLQTRIMPVPSVAWANRGGVKNLRKG
jgi:hypothetical protein